MFIKKKSSKLRTSKNDLFMNQKRHILQKGGLITPNTPPPPLNSTGMIYITKPGLARRVALC